jgi:hypothetical protein
MAINLRNFSAVIVTSAVLLVSVTTVGSAAPDAKKPSSSIMNPQSPRPNDLIIRNGTIYGEVQITGDDILKGYNCQEMSARLIGGGLVEGNPSASTVFSTSAKLSSVAFITPSGSVEQQNGVFGKCYYKITAPKKVIGENVTLSFSSPSYGAPGIAGCSSQQFSVKVPKRAVENNVVAKFSCSAPPVVN